MKSSHVVISRDWDNPQINIDITDESIGIKMRLDDFIPALVAELDAAALVAGMVTEIGNPTTLVTKAQLASALTDAIASSGLAARLGIAASNVVASLKRETTRVV